MLLGEKIKDAISKSEFNTAQVAEHIRMTENNLYRLHKKDSLEVKYLKGVCDLLKLPITYFFDEKVYHSISQTGSGNAGRDIKKQKNIFGAITNGNIGDHTNTAELQAKLQVCEAEKAGLEKLLAAKEEIIEVLKERG